VPRDVKDQKTNLEKGDNCMIQKNGLLYDKEMMSLYRGNAQIWGSAGPYLHTDRNRDGPR
jgi:hypothetical protein